MQLTKFQKLRSFVTEGRNLFVASMLGRSFTQKELQLDQLKHKQFFRQIASATLMRDNQSKPVHYLVKHETVLNSQKVDCHSILADFRNDQLYLCTNNKRENIIIKPLDSVSFEAAKPLKNQSRKTLRHYYNNMQFRITMISLIGMILLKKTYQKMMTLFL